MSDEPEAPDKPPKVCLGHTNSLPPDVDHVQQQATIQEPKGVFKQQSLRYKRVTSSDQGWSFGGVAKAVGSGVTAFGSGVVQGTKAVGTGVVQGTKAVGTGVVQGTKAVGTGVVQGTMAVGSGVVEGTKVVGGSVVSGTKVVGTGVVEGTKAAGRVTKGVTLAAGELAASGVSAVGTATVSAGKASADAVKWVMHESLGPDDEVHTVIPDETLTGLATHYNVGVRDLIRANGLTRRILRPGMELAIPHDNTQLLHTRHPNDVLAAKAVCGEGLEEGVCRFTVETVTWSVEGQVRIAFAMEDVFNINLDVILDDDLMMDCVPELLPAEVIEKDKKRMQSEEDLEANVEKNKCVVVEITNKDDDKDEEDDYLIKALFRMVDDPASRADCHSSSSEEDEEDEKSSSCSALTYCFRFVKSDLQSVTSFLELWHAERILTSDKLKDLLVLDNIDSDHPDHLDHTMIDVQSAILSEDYLRDLHLNMPPKIQNQSWRLAFSTYESGFSLRNLYRKIAEDQEPFLVVIQDDEDKVFGAYLTCTPRICENFIGTGKSWLFASAGQMQKRLQVFRWSGKNEYFFRGTTDNMIIGAEEGRFGIVIDGDLHKGRVQKCGTFEDWPLEEGDFTISRLELWKFY